MQFRTPQRAAHAELSHNLGTSMGECRRLSIMLRGLEHCSGHRGRISQCGRIRDGLAHSDWGSRVNSKGVDDHTKLRFLLVSEDTAASIFEEQPMRIFLSYSS